MASGARPQFSSNTQIGYQTTFDIYDEPVTLRKTGIVCTIGPASVEVATLKELINSGMDCVRLNFSHVKGNVTEDGKFENYDFPARILANARQASKECNKTIAYALDTKGPEIRTGNFKGDKEYIIEAGSKVTVYTDPAKRGEGDETGFWVDYTNIGKVCKEGDLMYVDDGLLSLKVVSVDQDNGYDFLTVVAQNTAAISNHKGVNLPNVEVDLPALSEKDKNDLRWGVANGVDFIFASFIRKAADIKMIRDTLGEEGKNIQIISKIENHEGVQKFDEILEVTDGVMVARGDLGIEIPSEKVFKAQKMMCSKCLLSGKECIVATQMLDSMIKNPRPTRAEITDVANAVFDGASCVMLSGETAKGKYPIESVKMMEKICREAENTINYSVLTKQVISTIGTDLGSGTLKPAEGVAQASVQTAERMRAKAIIVLTNTGTTARLLAKYRPPCPIIAVCGVAQTSRQLCLTSGVIVSEYDLSKGKPSHSERVSMGIKTCQTLRIITSPGDLVVCVHADQLNKGYANQVRIMQLD